MANISQLQNELNNKAKKQKLNTKDPVEKVKLALLGRGVAGIKNLSRWFRIMDDDRNQKLTLEEFKTGMRDFGLHDVTDAEFAEVFKRFDEDGSGTIDVTEFYQKMRPAMSQNRLNIVGQAFSKFDKSGDGIITTDDLGEYDISHHPKYINGEWKPKQCLEEFLKSFESEKHTDGTVTKEEFIAYYSALSCSIDDDSYFDLMMRKAWGL
ncbi:hypothetical protein SNE40_004957 [Patella caerulea]|uniref:EF-hand domain-containing protein n=1 Tax=Patella caerulea TaxID=87958 RepID=A0AAN8K5S5_PATCE